MRENDGKMELIFAFTGPSDVSVPMIEAVMTHMYCGLKSTWRDFEATRVTFHYPKPIDGEQYRRYFKCVLQFGSVANAIVFDNSYMKRPVSSSHDPYLYKVRFAIGAGRVGLFTRRSSSGDFDGKPAGGIGVC